MQWFIISLVVAFLLGSVMWVMPSPRQRYQAKLRLEARQKGIQVQMVQLTLPRALGEMEPEVRTVAAYRFPRTNLERRERDHWRGWEVLRIDTLHNRGLPEHWSWSKGAKALQPAALGQLHTLLQQLPEGVLGVESTPLSLTFYWDERGDETRLDLLHRLAQQALAQKI